LSVEDFASLQLMQKKNKAVIIGKKAAEYFVFIRCEVILKTISKLFS